MLVSERWECLSIWGRGTAGVIIQSALEPGRLYAGTGAGVNTSSDGGSTWRFPVTSRAPVLIEALAAMRCESNREFVFAGGPTGLYRSEDGGESWAPLLQTVHVRALAVIPAASGALDGQIMLAGTDQDGVLRSDDRGETWNASNPGLLDRTVLSLATTVDDEGREIALAGTGSGVFLSRNGGRAWKPVFIGDVGTDVEQIAIVEPAVIWAASHGSGLLQSVDGGLHWHAVASFPELSTSAVAVIRQEASERAVAVVSEQEAFFSTDGGREWEPAGTLPGPVMALLALETGDLLVGIAGQGIVRFNPITRVWQSSESRLQATVTGSLTVVAQDGAPPALLVSSPESLPACSLDLGNSWQAVPFDSNELSNAVPFGKSGTIIIPGESALLSCDLPSWRVRTLLETRIHLCDAREETLAAIEPEGRLWLSVDNGHTWKNTLLTPRPVAMRIHTASGASAEVGIVSAEPGNPGRNVLTIVDTETLEPSWTRSLGDSGVVDLVSLEAAGPTGGFVLVRSEDLVLLDPEDDHWNLHRASPDQPLRFTVAVAHDASGSVFLGTTTGIWRFSARDRTFEPWDSGLQETPILDLSIGRLHGTPMLFAICLGGSIWTRSLANVPL